MSSATDGSAEKSLLPGQCVGPYKIVSSIGGDTSARVYEAEHTFLGQRHALKVFETDAAHVGFLRRRLEAEKSMLIDLRHERIASIYDVGVDEGTGLAYYSMDIVLPSNGKPLTLKAVLAAGQVGEDRIAMWFKDICEGIAYLHSKGVLHRDISLENVLIGADGRAVVYDFGLARIIDDECRKVSRDRSAYMAPELLGGGAPSAATDAWALGVLIYRMLTGAWYENGKPERIAASLSGFRLPWAKVFSSLCAVRPEDRLTEHGGIGKIPEMLNGVVSPRDVLQVPETPPKTSPPSAGRSMASAVMQMRRKAVAAAKAESRPAVSSTVKRIAAVEIPKIDDGAVASKSPMSRTRLALLIVVAAILTIGGCQLLKKRASWSRQQREELARESARVEALRKAEAAATARAEAEKQRMKSAAQEALAEIDLLLNKVDLLDRDDGFFRLQSSCKTKVQETKRAFVAGRFDLVTNLFEIARVAMTEALELDGARRAARVARLAACRAANEAEAEGAVAFDGKSWNAAVSETASGDQDFDAMRFSASKPRYDRATAGFSALCKATVDRRHQEAEKARELAALTDGLRSTRESFVKNASWVATISALKAMLAGVESEGAKETIAAELARVELLRSVCKELRGEMRYGNHRSTFSVRTSRSMDDQVVFVWNVKKNVQMGDDLSWKTVFRKEDLLFRMFEAARASFVGAGRIRFELAYASFLDYFPRKRESSKDVVLKLIEGTDSAVVALATRYFPSVVKDAQESRNTLSKVVTPMKMPYDKYGWGEKQKPLVGAAGNVGNVRRKDFEEVSTGTVGEVPFDFSMNGGKFTIRDGNEGIALRWKGEKDGVHLLKQGNRRIGRCKVFTKIPDDVQDVQNAQAEEAADLLAQEGEFFIVESVSGRVLVLQVMSARGVKSGDDADSVIFRYRMYQ